MNKSWNPFSYPPQAVLKSLWGFFLPGLAIVLDSLRNNGHITWTDAGVALLTSLVGGYGTFAITNKPPGEITPAEAEGGYTTLNLALLVIGLVLLAVAVLGLLHVLAIALSICIILVVIGFLLVVGAQFGGTLP